MIAEKKTLTLEEIDSQTALELPARDLMALVTIVVGSISIPINIKNNKVAANVCLQVLNLGLGPSVTCTITQ